MTVSDVGFRASGSRPHFYPKWVVLYIGIPFIRVPYYDGDPCRDPNLENYPPPHPPPKKKKKKKRILVICYSRQRSGLRVQALGLRWGVSAVWASWYLCLSLRVHVPKYG